MTKQELYLKTMFCCMACDGDIAQEEIEMVRNMAASSPMFEGIDVEKKINAYVSAINRDGRKFLIRYLDGLSQEELAPSEQLQIVDLSIRMIEADNRIEYSEVKFFKKIRARLTLPDEQILARHPDKEDFLLPDIDVAEDPVWDENVTFASICLK